VIMAFPSREFGSQEFDSDKQIAEFAKSKNFPGILMKLGKVKGSSAPDIWKYMKRHTNAPDPAWNFNGKFLVSKNGKVSITKKVEKDIEVLMAEEIE